MTRASSPRGSRVFAALLACAAVSGCASSSDVMVLDLVYRPTSQPDQNKLQGVQPIAATSRVWVNPVIDQHPEGSRIGISEEEDNAPVYFGPRGLPPADFVRAALTQVLPAYAVPLHSDPATSTHVLEIRMSRFWTVEGNVYQAYISGACVLADSAGNVLWQAEIGGTNKRWGKTYSADNYMEVFSDAALDFGQNLALNPGFRAAVAGAPAPAPAG